MTNLLKRCKTCNKTVNKVNFRNTNKNCNSCLYQKRKDYLKAYSISYYAKHRKKLNKYHNEYYHKNKSKFNKPIRSIIIKKPPLELKLEFDILY